MNKTCIEILILAQFNSYATQLEYNEHQVFNQIFVNEKRHRATRQQEKTWQIALNSAKALYNIGNNRFDTIKWSAMSLQSVEFRRRFKIQYIIFILPFSSALIVLR